MELIEEIKDKFRQAEPRHEAIQEVAYATGYSFNYVRNMLSDSGGWQIKEGKEKTVLNAIEAVLDYQSEFKK